MKKLLFGILMLCLLSLYSQNNVQTSDPLLTYQKYIPSAPSSPSAYEFQRYGNIGLSEYTGTPQVSIPIYRIEEGKISVPISLNYNVGGIKVNQEASWVGLGWNLSFGGIYQTINDVDDLYYKENPQTNYRIRPDFASGNPAMINNFPKRELLYYQLYNGIMVGHPMPPTSTSNSSSVMRAYDYHVPVNGVLEREVDMFTSQNYDSEPDFFTANFFGHKLDFIFDFETYNVKILNEEGYKVEILRDFDDDISNQVTGYDFIITVPDGTKYYFEKDERILRQTSYPNYGGFHKIRSRNWKITKIRDINLNEVSFNYSNIQNVSNTPNIYQTYTQNLFTRRFVSAGIQGTPQDPNSLSFDTYSTGLWGSQHIYTYIPHTTDATYTSTFYDQTKQSVLYPLSIVWSKGQINFSTSSRIDRKGGKKLDQITVSNYSNNIKTLNFNYSYFQTDMNYNEIPNFNGWDTELNNRLKLNWIEENNSKRYSLIYNSTNLPPKNSTAVDYWGYFNGQNNNSLPANPIDLQPSSPYNLIDNGNNKNPSLTHSKASVLEEIQYPTKGKVTLEYELNSADNYIITSSNDKSRLPNSGNGLRLKKQSLFKNDLELAESTEYEYFDGKSLLPLVLQKQYNTHFCDDINSFVYNRSGYVYNATIFETNSNNSTSLNAFSGDSFVGYGKVIIKKTSGYLNNGRIEKEFYNNPGFTTMIHSEKHNGIIHRKHEDIANGSLLKSEFFDNNNDLVKKEIVDYEYKRSQIDYGVRLSNAGGIMYVYGFGGAYPSLIISSIDLLSYYPIFSGKTLSKSKITTEYFDSGNIETEEFYTYDGLNRITKKEINNLSAQTSITNNLSYQSSSNFTSRNMLLEPNLITKNVINNVNTGETKRIQYNYANHSFYGYPILNQITDCNENEVFSDCNSVLFSKYDNRGNAIEFSKENDIKTVILYDYNKNYILAKIENATYSQVASVLGVSETSLMTYTQANMSSINSLRNLLSNSFVTTFTHIPLVGISSITDPRGETVFYEYDSNNRLKYVRDKDNNIVSENQYNYKN